MTPPIDVSVQLGPLRLKNPVMVASGTFALFGLDGLTVSVTLRGRCTGCPASQATVHGTVERILREKVDPEIKVLEV